MEHLLGEANAAHGLGRPAHANGDHSTAADLLEHALAMFRDLGDRRGEAEVINSKGALIVETSGPAEALTVYRHALQVSREIHSSLDEARALEGTARCCERIGDRSTALTHLREALALYQRMEVAETAAIAALLVAWQRVVQDSGP